MNNSLKTSLSPTFVIALILSLIVLVLAVGFTQPQEFSTISYTLEVLKFWQKGFWGLLEFTLQMVLILVFGHTLAISKPVNRLLIKISKKVKTNTQAVLITGITAMVGGYINWGFGLILGAVLAREIGNRARDSGLQINYPLVAASGYLGMLVWHGGLSGSAPLKVAETGHFLQDQIGIISIGDTIFSKSNLLINLILVIVIGIVLLILSKRKVQKLFYPIKTENNVSANGKDSLGLFLGLFILLLGISDFFLSPQALVFFDLNYVNFMLFGAGLLLFKSLSSYIEAIKIALSGAVEIILQFPFYAGILGVLQFSGLLVLFSEWMIGVSTGETFPLLSFVSAGLVNLFIPSGGGQWAIQGPIIMDAAVKLGLKPANLVMAFSYGDQISNMLQPFWALPLLSITGVAAKEILRYTFFFFLAALIVFGVAVFFLL
ncbi:TIGR00366 family protein [Belliella sp. R4-6]|uniref:TIGR00366 family protein n=1 Tax=Belliella alkalica TaxID=1730871 RepID=A0ABS9VGT1_9BACT|nr:TIGR00366 family protein [Belliella alkalica]MCH7415652.1 TIGR00366 family protein [Belliella alkalica]